MLSRLHIENFALIDKLDIDFGDGLNVLTGATGAGKSIIIGALDLVLGGRGSEEIIRTGETNSFVEANFILDSKDSLKRLKDKIGDYIDGNSLLIRREYKVKGGGKAFIGQSQVNVSLLREFSGDLADILGQHSHQALLDPSTHCGYLDRFAELDEKVAQLKTLYARTMEFKEKLAHADRYARELKDKIDLLNFQINEIKKADLKTDEEEKLKNEKKLLENGQKIKEAIDMASAELLENDGSAVEIMGVVQKTLSPLAAATDEIKESLTKIAAALETINDAVIGLKNLVDKINDDPERLEQVNERLDEIFKLKKKYGSNIADVIEYCRKSEIELNSLKTRQLDMSSLQKDYDIALDDLNKLAAEISKKRYGCRSELEDIVILKLNLMGMPKAQFSIKIDYRENDSGPYRLRDKLIAGDSSGFDIVEFQFCANPGEGLKPLAKIASGGEISRVMLALKNAFLKKKGSGCEVFDEIDVGISGEVAAKVARQLKELSKKHQVVCITHLHQIASLADNHYRVYKDNLKGRSVTRIMRLSGDERVREIAGLLSGEKITEAAIAGAKKLLDESGKRD